MKRKRQCPLVRVTPPPGHSPDDVDQHMTRWRREMAFRIRQHPHLIEKAKKLGIVLDEDDPGTVH
jgi:hypothetical protein